MNQGHRALLGDGPHLVQVPYLSNSIKSETCFTVFKHANTVLRSINGAFVKVDVELMCRRGNTSAMNRNNLSARKCN